MSLKKVSLEWLMVFSQAILMLLLTSFVSSCATSAQESLLPQEFREYNLICGEELQGFQYSYNVCTKRILGFCTKSELTRIVIEAKFKDDDNYKELCHKNFILKVQEQAVKF